SSAPTGMYDPTGELGFAAVLPLVPVISGPPGWVVGGIVAAGITLTGLYLYQKNKEAQEETARWERFVREEMKTRADKEKQKEKQKYPAADPEDNFENISKTRDKLNKVRMPDRIRDTSKSKQKADKRLKDQCTKK